MHLPYLPKRGSLVSSDFCSEKIKGRKYFGKMLNVCRRYSRDRDEASDMLQEGFIRVFKNIKQYSFQGSFEGWIRRVIVTSALNYYKKFHLNGHVDYVDQAALTLLEAA